MHEVVVMAVSAAVMGKTPPDLPSRGGVRTGRILGSWL